MIKFGIVRNFDPAAQILSFRNREINRYMFHQLRRLQGANDRTYWVLVKYLIRKSKCFRVSALHHVYCSKSFLNKNGKRVYRPAWYKG